MSIAVTSEQVQFAEGLKRWAADQEVRKLTRELLDGADTTIDALWQRMADFGWTGLLVPESLGGSGATWVEGAVLAEAMGYACAPFPIAPTLTVSSLLATVESDDAQLLLKGVAEGRVRFGASRTGGARPVVVGGLRATHVVVPEADDVGIYDVAGVELVERALLDVSAGTCEVVLGGEPLLRIPGAAAELRVALGLFAAADSVGVSMACLAMAVDYAQVREAFGRAIGSFQAVKHHCANMLLAAQLASAATWRAAAAQGGVDEAALVDGAAYLAGTAALTCAKTTLQVLGGIGFTWEHDLHLYLRRAGVTLGQMGPMESVLAEAGQAELDGVRPTTSIALPPEAAAKRVEVAAFRERILSTPLEQRHDLVVDEGYLHPHWPRPWGRAAGPLEQLVIEEVLHDVDRVSALGETYWEVPIVLPTILECGTPEQIERWMRPSMVGRVHWCQLFSEPSAGSDLAALKTRAVRTEGGWLVTGQKVWTSDAHHADLGMALVRTDPEAKKHRGISCMMIDMRAPGVDIRPLRQITGEADFNEVFLDDVFVPDEDVLGPVNGGWGVARTTLGHERVSLGARTRQWIGGSAWERVLELVRSAVPARPELLRPLGELIITSEGATALHLRSAYRALLGQPAGIDGTIGKTVIADFAQRVGDFCLTVMGESAAFADGNQTAPARMFLHVRMATIAGGTSEVLRNLLAEQALKLPREPVHA
jgi:alkylation response protein AidB-like acyl-CoA dehydrogenase